MQDQDQAHGGSGFRAQERDLVLPPGQFAYVLDETKGLVTVHNGPTKTSLSNTDKPVLFSPKSRTYEASPSLDRAIQQCPIAGEGDYILLENPSTVEAEEHPLKGNTSPPNLNFGRKINIPGPITFALWPGQIATVVPGHRLKTNQYLLCRVYNDQAAKENWESAVVITSEAAAPEAAPEGGQSDESKGDKGAPEAPKLSKPLISKDDITMGQLFIVKGSDASFYIPPTGVEVLIDENVQYARNAVTLERLEFCILVDEDGNKRYEHGPNVVFPKPTETFLKSESDKSRRFRAFELNGQSGIYVMVIADYEDGEKHKAGEELFLTGDAKTIYFPREEHSIIKYGGKHDVHYAIAIPKGEGRYLLNRKTGVIKLVEGPEMYLPDPREEVVVRRVLTQQQVADWYPGNRVAAQYNAKLAAAHQTKGGSVTMDYMALDEMDDAAASYSSLATTTRARQFGDVTERKSSYTPPRTVVIDSKYDGVPVIGVWNGYVVQINDKSGKSRVVQGPANILLEYDETLEVMKLSTGKAKSDDHILKAAYLRHHGNKVSDIVTVETKDMCTVTLRLSHCVNFAGDKTKWFRLENYIKFMCDHIRSLLKGAVKRYTIEEFYANSINIIRDTILGVMPTALPDAPNPNTERPGLLFDENNMQVYDVEVLDVEIGDGDIADLLSQAQHTSVEQAIEVGEAETRLAATKRLEDIKRQQASAKADTIKQTYELRAKEAVLSLEEKVTAINAALQQAEENAKVAVANESSRDATHASQLVRGQNEIDQEVAADKARQGMAIQMIEKEADALVKKFSSFEGDFASVALAMSNNEVMAKLAHASAPMTILGGDSIVTILNGLFKGTPMEKVFGDFSKVIDRGVIGSSTKSVPTE